MKLINKTDECGYKQIASILTCMHPEATCRFCERHDFPDTCPLKDGISKFDSLAARIKDVTLTNE